MLDILMAEEHNMSSTIDDFKSKNNNRSRYFEGRRGTHGVNS